MTGGLSILLQNKQNNIATELYYNPQISFFKYVFRRNTNFFMQNIEIYNKTHNITNLNNIKDEIDLNSELNGDLDLLSNLYISFYLPKIYSDNKYRFKWVENIGALLIKNAVFTINGQDIDSFTGEWLCVWNELNSTVKETFNKMSGNTIETNNPRSNENIIRIKNNIISYFDYPSSDKNNLNNPPSIEGKWVTVKLPFWFSKAPNLALPIFGTIWKENTFKLNITYEDIENLYTVYSDVYNMNISPKHYNELHKENISINNFIQTENILIKISAGCIILDDDKETLNKSTSDGITYLYETVRIKSDPYIQNNINVEIRSRFLIKELIWTLKRSDAITNFNDLLNYSYNIPFNNEKNILKDAKITWENEDVISLRDSFYFNQIQPYEYHNTIPKQGIYLYSFSLLPGKSIHSGSYNNTGSDKINIHMNLNSYQPSILDDMYEKKFNNKYNKKYNVSIYNTLYITEYNFLIIMNKKIKLRYSI
jgi:hypothetical protein